MAMRQRENLLDLAPDEAEARLWTFMSGVGEPYYRARQVLRRLWQNPAASFDAMTELPAALRKELDTTFALPRLELVVRQKAVDGTQKFPFRLSHGEAIETVAVPDGQQW